jgi:hypothetical protein
LTINHPNTQGLDHSGMDMTLSVCLGLESDQSGNRV